LYGERGGTRTLDPMIKSHVLYRLSYALTLFEHDRFRKTGTHPAIQLRGRLFPDHALAALCRGQAPAGQ
jgi:hypothetical protein